MMFGIHYGPSGAAAEYTGRKHLVGDVTMYEYRGQEAPIQDVHIFSERAPEAIYCAPVIKINTFRDSGL